MSERRRYGQNVFLNCPFDRQYAPLFEAIVFTVFDCGFRPLCARERMNSGEIRLDKILGQIRDARFSIHDLSRTQLDDKNSLPRFNMPLELGIAIGCAKFGAGRQRDKSVLILDTRRYRYHKFVSDIAGQDISEHRDRPARVIEAVRNWLRTESKLTDIPGAEYVVRRYRRFKRDLPKIAAAAHLNATRLTYVDYCHMVSAWLTANAKPAVVPSA